jgi:agmatine deiminase
MRTLPGEWEKHRCTVMAWPTREAVWGELRRLAEEEYAALANTIALDEPVLLVCDSEDLPTVREVCGRDG